MDPKELQKFERGPAFDLYPSGAEDTLPPRIKEIRAKWVRLGVDIYAVWRVIRKGYDLYEDNYVIDLSSPNRPTCIHKARERYNSPTGSPTYKFIRKLSLHMRALIKRIGNDKRTEGQKESDRKVLIAHCGENAVDAFEIFVQQVKRRDPPLKSVNLPDPRKRKRGRPAEVIGPAAYLITKIVRKRLTPKRGPKNDRFYWPEIGDLLSFYYPWELHLTKNNLKNFHKYHHREGIPADWPKPEVFDRATHPKQER